jgi:FkbM family methyltransferase
MNPSIRRLTWRLGRRLYCAARGEPNPNLPLQNGEIDLARRVISSVPATSPLTIVDVGANIGDWLRPVLDALPADRFQGSTTRVFAFEPVPETRAILSRNIAAHARDALVSVEACALSNEAGDAQMTTFDAGAGTHTLRTVSDAGGAATGLVSVKVSTLTNFARERGLSHIDLIKIDTEGFDRLVLEGAQPLFAADRISVAQFEYNHRWVATRSFLKDVFEMLDGLPYAVARLMPDHVELIDGWHPELERYFEANFAVIHQATLPRLAVLRGRFDASNTYA